MQLAVATRAALVRSKPPQGRTHAPPNLKKRLSSSHSQSPISDRGPVPAAAGDDAAAWAPPPAAASKSSGPAAEVATGKMIACQGTLQEAVYRVLAGGLRYGCCNVHPAVGPALAPHQRSQVLSAGDICADRCVDLTCGKMNHRQLKQVLNAQDCGEEIDPEHYQHFGFRLTAELAPAAAFSSNKPAHRRSL